MRGHNEGTRGHVPDEACSDSESVRSARMLPFHWPSVGRRCCPIMCLEGVRAGTFLAGSSPPAAAPDSSPRHSEKSQSPSNAPRSCPMSPFPLALSFPAVISCGPAGLLAGPPTHQTLWPHGLCTGCPPDLSAQQALSRARTLLTHCSQCRQPCLATCASPPLSLSHPLALCSFLVCIAFFFC